MALAHRAVALGAAGLMALAGVAVVVAALAFAVRVFNYDVADATRDLRAHLAGCGPPRFADSFHCYSVNIVRGFDCASQLGEKWGTYSVSPTGGMTAGC